MAIEILSENAISAYSMKEELFRIKKRDKELNFRAAKTEEHLLQIYKQINASSIYDKIGKLSIPRLRGQHINKIIDIMPRTVRDLKVVLQGYPISLNNESMKKIISAISPPDKTTSKK